MVEYHLKSRKTLLILKYIIIFNFDILSLYKYQAELILIKICKIAYGFVIHFYCVFHLFVYFI